MSWRFFVFLTFFFISGVTTAQVNKNDSPWEQINDHSWILEIRGVGRHETIVLITVGKDLLFTANSPCPHDTSGQTYWWKDGEKFARGVNCKNKAVLLPVKKHWERWIKPLPKEALDIQKSPFGRGLMM